jgi:hypothetical protein
MKKLLWAVNFVKAATSYMLWKKLQIVWLKQLWNHLYLYLFQHGCEISLYSYLFGKAESQKPKERSNMLQKLYCMKAAGSEKSTFRFHPFGWHYAFLHWSLLVSLFGLTPWKKKAPHLVFYGHRETFFLCLTFSQVMARLVLPSFVLNVLYVKDRACDRWGVRRWMGSK